MNQLIPAISNKVISGEMKELKELRLIDRKEFKEHPPRVEYRLTKAGQSMMPLLFELAN